MSPVETETSHLEKASFSPEQLLHKECTTIPVDSYRNFLIALIASKGCATKYLQVESFLSGLVSLVCLFLNDSELKINFRLFGF